MNSRPIKNVSLIACLTIVGLGFGGNAHASSGIISVDFGIDGSPQQSGVEPAAAAASPLFGNANVWNHLNFDKFGPVKDPAFSSLVDSEGNPTAVGFSIKGSVGGFSNNDRSQPLRTDYLFFNSRGLSFSIDWQITGLAPNSKYQLFAYGAIPGFYVRDCEMLVDTNGNGDFTDETAQLIGTATADASTSKDAFFPSVVTDASGSILGITSGIDNPQGDVFSEANWGGFQIAAVPEPVTHSQYQRSPQVLCLQHAEGRTRGCGLAAGRCRGQLLWHLRRRWVCAAR